MWGEITYPFPNFNNAAVEVWEWISYFIQHFIGHARIKVDPCQLKDRATNLTIEIVLTIPLSLATHSIVVTEHKYGVCVQNVDLKWRVQDTSHGRWAFLLILNAIFLYFNPEKLVFFLFLMIFLLTDSCYVDLIILVYHVFDIYHSKVYNIPVYWWTMNSV